MHFPVTTTILFFYGFNFAATAFSKEGKGNLNYSISDRVKQYRARSNKEQAYVSSWFFAKMPNPLLMRAS